MKGHTHIRVKRAFLNDTPLITTRTKILNHVKEQNMLKKSNPIRLDLWKQDYTKYCKIHKDHGYDIEDFFELKEGIENLIHRGQLKQFMVQPERGRGQQTNC